MAAVRGEEFAAVVERERPLLQGIAYLLTGDAVRADRLVQAVWARMYERWPEVRRPQVEAIRALIRAEPLALHLPWERQPRVELVERLAGAAALDPIVADLRMLTPDLRTVIILERYAELPSVQIAEVVGRTIDQVLVLSRQARAVLAAGHPERATDQGLAQELRDAIPFDRRVAHGSADDLAHGRRLVRRRRLRRGAAAVAAALLLVAGIAVLLPHRDPAPAAAPLRVVVMPSPNASCSITELTCRGKILFTWRSEMAEVVRSNLDPDGQYFSGFGYRYDDRYETPGFWSGQEGALAFEVFRLDQGATEVYVQIATSRRTAVRCGETTRTACTSTLFMDGYRMTISGTTVSEGIEVQYRPTEDEVITVIARNTTRGKTLDLISGDLVKLVQDPRLRLPEL